jgi:hypothetical protein
VALLAGSAVGVTFADLSAGALPGLAGDSAGALLAGGAAGALKAVRMRVGWVGGPSGALLPWALLSAASLAGAADGSIAGLPDSAVGFAGLLAVGAVGLAGDSAGAFPAGGADGLTAGLALVLTAGRMSVGWVGGAPTGGLLSAVLLAAAAAGSVAGLPDPAAGLVAGSAGSLTAAGLAGISAVVLSDDALLTEAVAESPVGALSPSASSDPAGGSNQPRSDDV